MNSLTKNKWLSGFIILLLLANIVTIFLFWRERGQHHQLSHPDPGGFLVRELNLDSAQQNKLNEFAHEHQQATRPIRDELKKAKDEYFDLLKDPATPDSLLQQKLSVNAAFTRVLDSITYRHFQQIRSICRPDQQKKFDEIIHQVTSMIAMPHPPPQGDKPPSPGDRPPPP
jgi:protein CpxP